MRVICSSSSAKCSRMEPTSIAMASTAPAAPSPYIMLAKKLVELVDHLLVMPVDLR